MPYCHWGRVLAQEGPQNRSGGSPTQLLNYMWPKTLEFKGENNFSEIHVWDSWCKEQMKTYMQSRAKYDEIKRANIPWHTKGRR
jgi:hypothetical protein